VSEANNQTKQGWTVKYIVLEDVTFTFIDMFYPRYTTY